ncbi:hypothetical protein [Nonomuraea sp. NPDC050202]|jgi:hypothetical protein|uniref:hypothetical protein n=1 Tax=unclassified Nonomuraea TaxID=2593643 RepID=UPI0033F6FF33
MEFSSPAGAFDLQLRALPVHAPAQAAGTGPDSFTIFSCRNCNTLKDTCTDTCADTCCYDSRYC